MLLLCLPALKQKENGFSLSSVATTYMRSLINCHTSEELKP